MTRWLIGLLVAVVTLGASSCAVPPPRLEAPTSFLVDPSDSALVDAVGEALALWQPAVPFELSLQVGGFQGENGWVIRRAKTKSHGRTDWERSTVTIGAPAPWVPVTVRHEIGHVLGLDHDTGAACGDGVMGVDDSVVARDATPSECELAVLGSLYGVELPDAPNEAQAISR